MIATALAPAAGEDPAASSFRLALGGEAAGSLSPGPVTDLAAGTEQPHWIHLDLLTPETTLLVQELGLTEECHRDLTARGIRPTARQERDALFLILRTEEVPGDRILTDVVSIRLHWQPGRLLTTSARTSTALKEVRDRLSRQPLTVATSGIDPALKVLLLLVETATDHLADLVLRMDDLVTRIEEDMIAMRMTGPPMRRRVGRFRRDLARIWRRLVPQGRALLQAERVLAQVAPEALPVAGPILRDHARETQEILDHLGQLRDQAAVLNDQSLAMLQERTARTTYWLTLISAVFLPLNLFAGLLGMNLQGIPYADQPWAFPAVLLSLPAVVAAELLLLRWMKLL